MEKYRYELKKYLANYEKSRRVFHSGYLTKCANLAEDILQFKTLSDKQIQTLDDICKNFEISEKIAAEFEEYRPVLIDLYEGFRKILDTEIVVTRKNSHIKSLNTEILNLLKSGELIYQPVIGSLANRAKYLDLEGEEINKIRESIYKINQEYWDRLSREKANKA